jgi:hypothetical protein
VRDISKYTTAGAAMLDKGWKFRSYFFLFLLSLTFWPLTKDAHGQTDSFNLLAGEIVRLVRRTFLRCESCGYVGFQSR